MSHSENITKKKKYKHLNITERQIIERELKKRTSAKRIAEILGRHKSTITREIKRGSVIKVNWNNYMSKNLKYPSFIEHNVYQYDIGQRKYKENREKCRYEGKQHICQDLIEFVKKEVLSKAKTSLNEVIEYAKLCNLFPAQYVSTKTFYNWIDNGICGISNFNLLRKIGRKAYNKCKCKEHKRIYGKSIDERPILVEQREEFGHWEGDLIVGKKGTKSCVFTLVERKTRIFLSFKILNKESKSVIEVIDMLKIIFGIHFSNIFKTITFDNGSEFSDGYCIEACCETKVYYAHPRSSYERGSNENCNGIFRRYLPKGTNFDDVTDEEIKEVMGYINNKHRKILGYKSAIDLWKTEISIIIQGEEFKHKCFTNILVG